MKIQYTNQKDCTTYELNLAKLSYIPLTKETIEEMIDLCEPSEIGNIIIAAYNSIYNDSEQEMSKVERAMTKRIFNEEARLSLPHFLQIHKLKNQEDTIRVIRTNDCNDDEMEGGTPNYYGTYIDGKLVNEFENNN